MCLASFLAKFSFLGGHRGTQPMNGSVQQYLWETSDQFQLWRNDALFERSIKMKTQKTILTKSLGLWEWYEWNCIPGNDRRSFWATQETLLLTVSQTTRPREGLCDCSTVLLMALQAPHQSSYHWPHFGSRQSGRMPRRCSGWKSWFHTRPNSCRHWSLLRFLSEGFLTLQEKIPKQHILRKLPYQAAFAWRKGLIPSNQCWYPVHTLADNRRRRKQRGKTPTFKPILP